MTRRVYGVVCLVLALLGRKLCPVSHLTLNFPNFPKLEARSLVIGLVGGCLSLDLPRTLAEMMHYYMPNIYYPGSVIHLQPMVIDPAVADQKPPNNIEYAIVACLCCNGLCLGLIALCFALGSDAAYQKGKVN